MTEDGSRTGAARDVPPPRPVARRRPRRSRRPAWAGPPARWPTPSPVWSARPPDARVRPRRRPARRGRRRAARRRRRRRRRGRRRVRAAAAPGTRRPAGAGRAGGDRGRRARCSATCSPRPPRGCPSATPAGCGAAYPGASDDEIADALVARAARLTSGIGAATGGLVGGALVRAGVAARRCRWSWAPRPCSSAAVEVVLVGELHELYGRPPAGDARARAAAYLASWSAQRSVDGAGAAALGSLLGGAGVAGAAPAGDPQAGRRGPVGRAVPARRRARRPRQPAGHRDPGASGCWPTCAAPGRPADS